MFGRQIIYMQQQIKEGRLRKDYRPLYKTMKIWALVEFMVYRLDRLKGNKFGTVPKQTILIELANFIQYVLFNDYFDIMRGKSLTFVNSIKRASLMS